MSRRRPLIYRWPFYRPKYSEEAIRDAEEIRRLIDSGYYSKFNPESPYYQCDVRTNIHSENRKPTDKDYGNTKYRLVERSQYLAGRQKMAKMGGNLDVLDSIITLLLIDVPLPKAFNPHKLNGKMDGMWECHVKNAGLGDDWVLIYQYEKNECNGKIDLVLIAVNTGTHKRCGVE